MSYSLDAGNLMPPILPPGLDERTKLLIANGMYFEKLLAQEMRAGISRAEAIEIVTKRGPVSVDSPFHKLLSEGIERVKEAVESEERLATSANRTLKVLKSAGQTYAPTNDDPAS